jgi:hypothetical protein
MSETPGTLGPDQIELVRTGVPEAFTQGLARSWTALNPHEDRPHATEGSRFRHSWSGKCARALQYLIQGVEPSDPLGVESYWTFAVGQFAHDTWQAALEHMMPGVELEMGIPSIDVHGSASLDAGIFYDDGTAQAVEIKSLNGYGYKRMVGAGTKKEGPRSSAVLQLAMNAHALADHTRVTEVTGGWLLVVAVENISVGVAARSNISNLNRFMKAYYFTRAELEELAVPEVARVITVLKAVDARLMVPRVIPDPELPPNAMVTDPRTGTWQVLAGEGQVVDAGKTWHCDYCDFRSQCIEDGQ